MTHADRLSGAGPAGVALPLEAGRRWWRDRRQTSATPRSLSGLITDGRRITLFAKVIVLGMVLALAFAFFMSHYLGKGYPYNTFLVSVDNCFMDFFNVNYYSYDLDPYPTQIPYPPLGMLLARCFAFGFDYSAHGALAARDSLAGQLSALILAGSFIAFFFVVVYRSIRTGSRARDLQLTLALCASYPVLFLIDRGNYVMVAFAFVFGFIHFYDRNRALASLFLALAISTKLYPLLFLMLLAADRRWRDCGAVLGLTIALNLAALMLFKGDVFTNTRLFIRNLVVFSKGFDDPILHASWNVSFTNLVRVPYLLFFHANPPHLSLYYPMIVLAALGLAFYALRREQAFWKRVLIVTIAQLGIPAYMGDHNLVYLILPLLLYFREAGEMRREDYFYLVCAGLLFVPKDYCILGAYGAHQVLTPQAFINPLLMLGLFVKVALPRSTRFVLGGGALVGLAGVAFCMGNRLVHRDIPAPGALSSSAPWLGMKGHAGNWLLRKGFTLTGTTDILRAYPIICLRGSNPYMDRLGGKLPRVQARLVVPEQQTKRVPALLLAEGREYVLTINLDPRDLPNERPAEIRLSFDNWFVPKKIGLGDDWREFVIPTPHVLALLPAQGGSAPWLGMKGHDGNWVLREGFTVTAGADVLRHRPLISLRGLNLSMDRLGGKLPTVTATVHIGNRPPAVTPAFLRADGGEYVLTASLNPGDLPEQGPVDIRFSFAKWFVPKAMGQGDDARELVIPTPHTLTLRMGAEMGRPGDNPRVGDSNAARPDKVATPTGSRPSGE